MSCHADRVRAHKGAARKAVPQLNDAQLEAVWAIWAYVNNDRRWCVSSYLSNEAGLSREEIDKVTNALTSLAFVMF
jgi:hypothetical protein